MIEGLAYIENFLSLEEELRILDQIRALTFYHDIFRGRQLRRAYAQFGLRYGSTGRRLEPCAPFPEFLDELKRKLTGFCPAEEPLNQCIIAHYPPGAGIGWHTDAPAFGNCIAGISLGGPAQFEFRRNDIDRTEHVSAIRPRSLYTMQGFARWNCQHRVAGVKVDRLSLTLRHVPGRV